MIGVDCSSTISGAALKAAGRQFVFRYLSSWSNPKNDGQAEVADHHAFGIAEGLVFEDSNYSVTPGQAQTAVAHAQALGAPAGVAIFMACDENPAPASAFDDMVASAAIIRAAGYLAGWYGNKDTARALQGGSHIDAAWVVDTWGQDTPTDRWNFRQLPNSPNLSIGGVDCDQDDAPFPVGLWMPAAPPPPPAQKVKPMYNPPITVPPIVASLGCPTGGAWTLHTDGAVDNWGGAPFVHGVNGQSWFVGPPAQMSLPNQTPTGCNPPAGDEVAAGKKLVVFNGAGQRYALPA